MVDDSSPTQCSSDSLSQGTGRKLSLPYTPLYLLISSPWDHFVRTSDPELAFAPYYNIRIIPTIEPFLLILLAIRQAIYLYPSNGVLPPPRPP